jgi:hypothetical protein
MTSSGLEPVGRERIDREVRRLSAADDSPPDSDRPLFPPPSDSSTQTGAWSLAPGSPRTARSTPAA